MTLIVGLNLSDRLYLAGDTRVTFANGSFKDDIIKISEIAGEQFYLIGEEQRDPICLAVAGNLGLATFLFREVKAAIESYVLPDDIRKLLEDIQPFVAKKVDEWLQSGHPYKSCCLIFGGSYSKRRKKISRSKLEILQSIVRENVAPPEELERVKNQLLKDPFFQQLAKRIPRDRLMRPFVEPDAMLLNPLVQEAVDSGSEDINASDSLIFSLVITKNGIGVEVAEWGEFLAYGTDGLTRDDLSEEFLASMELSPGQLVNQKDLMESQYLRGHILKIAEDKGIKEIGGTVTPSVIRDNLFQDFFGFSERDLHGNLIQAMYAQQNGIFYVKRGTPPIKMQRFYEYQQSETSAEL